MVKIINENHYRISEVDSRFHFFLIFTIHASKKPTKVSENLSGGRQLIIIFFKEQTTASISFISGDVQLAETFKFMALLIEYLNETCTLILYRVRSMTQVILTKKILH